MGLAELGCSPVPLQADLMLVKNLQALRVNAAPPPAADAATLALHEDVCRHCGGPRQELDKTEISDAFQPPVRSAP